MIVKMIILRLLGSSDDKEKIDADNLLSPVKPMMSKLHSSVQ